MKKEHKIATKLPSPPPQDSLNTGLINVRCCLNGFAQAVHHISYDINIHDIIFCGRYTKNVCSLHFWPSEPIIS